MARGTMRVVDASSSLMRCRVCGATQYAMARPDGGGFYRGAWQCPKRDDHPATDRPAA